MIYTKYALKLRGFPFTSSTKHVQPFMGVKLTPTWPTVLFRNVKGKTCNFEANLCGSLYSTFELSIVPYAFHNKRVQMLFNDRPVRSKAHVPLRGLEFKKITSQCKAVFFLFKTVSCNLYCFQIYYLDGL